MIPSRDLSQHLRALIVMTVGSGTILGALAQDVAAVQRKATQRILTGPVLTIYTPKPEQFELAAFQDSDL
jgi:hypothetical protein